MFIDQPPRRPDDWAPIAIKAVVATFCGIVGLVCLGMALLSGFSPENNAAGWLTAALLCVLIIRQR